MDNPSQITFQMRISSIQVLSYSQFEIEGLDPVEDREMEFQTKYDLRLLEETSEVAVISFVKIKLLKRDVYFIEMKTQVNFKVDPLMSVVRKESNSSFSLPDTLVLNLTNISTGAIRGILFERMRGSILQNEVFPLIDLNSIIHNRN